MEEASRPSSGVLKQNPFGTLDRMHPPQASDSKGHDGRAASQQVTMDKKKVVLMVVVRCIARYLSLEVEEVASNVHTLSLQKGLRKEILVLADAWSRILIDLAIDNLDESPCSLDPSS